jgi:hypothetical protein
MMTSYRNSGILERMTDTEAALARAVLQIADAGDMPDTYWGTDSRVRLARDVLGVPAGGRYTHSGLWDEDPTATT